MAVASSHNSIAARTSATSAWRFDWTSPWPWRWSSQQTGVDLAVAQLAAAEQLEQEALVGGALLDHHHRVGDRPSQARDRLLARAAVRDDLGDHRIELRGHQIPLGESTVDPHSASSGRRSRVILPVWAREPEARVLCVQAGLNRVSARGRRLALQRASGGHVEVEGLDQVDAGHHLGDGVLDLKPRVDLHEREPALGGLVQELDGGGPAVAGELGQPGRRFGQIALLLGCQNRAGRLLDDLLMPALIAAVAHAQRPYGAHAVGDQLDFDVASGSDKALHQHARVTERLLGLLAGALERVLELVGALNPAHPATAAARGGLDHHGEPELLALAHGVLDGLDRLAAPGRHRHIGLLGQALALDLVA